ncbi:hypothetical protein [Furfurilactobacillus siliginis]|nr:hypothetical protein [Furfurilactobacillus siliginis]GEK28533.1 hypothetical protein LSI01_08440 [Furfurilactobacillus siliginis]
MQMKSTRDQQWLAQLLNVNIGAQFFVSVLPIYRKTDGDFKQMARIQNAFDHWIEDTHSYYVQRKGNTYLRLRS